MISGSKWKVFLLFLSVFSVVWSQTIPVLRIGAMLPKDVPSLQTSLGYQTTAGALKVAHDRIRDEHLLDGYNFTFSFFFDQCDENLAAGGTVQLIRDQQVDVIIGPCCSSSVVVSGVIAGYYNFPLFVWGTVLTSEITDSDRFPTVASSATSTYSLVQALGALFKLYNWDEFAFFYAVKLSSVIPRCSYVQDDIDKFVSSVDNMTLVYKRSTANDSQDTLRTVLRRMKTTARIIVSCFENADDRRNFLLAAIDEGLMTDDFLFIYLQHRQDGFGTPPFWIDTSTPLDGRDEEVRKACEKILILDLQAVNITSTDYSQEVVDAMHGWPFYCQGSDCPDDNANATRQSSYMADAFYMYARALNRTLAQSPNSTKDGAVLVRNSRGTFSGFSGDVNINVNGTREPVFYVFGLSSDGQQVVYLVMKSSSNSNVDIQLSYSDERTSIWANHGGVRPLSHPKCDFNGQGCPVPFFEQNVGYVVGGIILIVAVIIFIGVLLYYSYRSRKEQRRKLDALWQIGFQELSRPKEKDVAKSARSLESGISSTSTRFTIESRKETSNFVFFYFAKEPVVAKKHTSRPRMIEKDFVEFRFLRQIEHDNLCKFLGLCLDAPVLMSIWKYCGRGSLQEVIERATIQMDGFFMVSLIRDIAEGLFFIHSSSTLQFHGQLSSKTCLVDERWQIKISMYGLRCFRLLERREKDSLIWCAPEILRNEDDTFGSKTGDIYSFAIIASEILTRKHAWGLGENDLDVDEIVYRVKKGGGNPLRPVLAIEPTVEVNNSLFHLVRDCWAEKPDERPKIEVVRSLLKSMHSGRAGNLMDHVFNILEQYATNLEQEVEVRTKELAEEKKKSDILLYRMLPRQVADKLKVGQGVEPESFDSVSVFFSDVVSFTTLAGKCTPLQVVNLLNDLYSTFDTIIDEHSCYKVETIGDGYLCVSGLPLRNGNMHARDIAEMSFGFLRAIKTFRIPHLPGERINIRIGIHTGPCVAGVVGLTMPRYCLFGDTVNTASRMESNGKPGKIHISSTTNHYLTKIIGFDLNNRPFRTQTRGEVIIKGKGVMETFFLLTEDDDYETNEQS